MGEVEGRFNALDRGLLPQMLPHCHGACGIMVSINSDFSEFSFSRDPEAK